MSVEKLRKIMAQLRDPDGGCPWDLKQDFASIAPYTVEEAYEVADAIERNAIDELPDELGDLLLQVVYHTQLAEEKGYFTFSEVTEAICDKMIRRHPHVFGEEDLKTDISIKGRWEQIKRQERQEAGKVSDTSILAGLTRSLPALVLAQKVQKKVARIGFDWQDTNDVFAKITEETEEIHKALADKEGEDAVAAEVGDLLFSVVNLARHLGVDAEQALRRSTRKFETRFRGIELLASEQSLNVTKLTLEELDSLWDKVKASES